MTVDDKDKPLYEIDDSPLYSIPDDADDSALSAPVYEEDEDDEEDEEEDLNEDGESEEETEVKKLPSPFSVMLKTMLGPMEGWKALKRARFSSEEFAARCFYPLIALAALSEGSMLFYEANMTVSEWAKAGLATFITFFFGYFTVLLLGGMVLPRQSRDIMKKEIGKQFVMLSMSTLALFWVIVRLLPMLQPVLVFLPLWTVYIIFKGVRRLRVPKEVENSTTGLLCMLVIGVPILWNWIMTEILLQ